MSKSTPPARPSPLPSSSSSHSRPSLSSRRSSSRSHHLTPSPHPSLHDLPPLPSSPTPSRTLTPARSSFDTSPRPSLSRQTTRSPSPTPTTHHPNHTYRSPPAPIKPPLPLNTVSLDSPADGDGDETPFESIPLSSTPPPPSPTLAAPLPSSPTSLKAYEHERAKRSSWSGFGVSHSRHASSSSSGLAHPRASTADGYHPNGHSHDAAPHANGHDTTTTSADTPSTPRLHAPPAHPHPFPLPSSPPTHQPRLSTSSSTTSTAHPPPQPSHSSSQPHPHAKAGPSTFQKVISHTRPAYLPPKPKEEDESHYHQWEALMAQSREHEAARRKEQEAQRAEREKRMREKLPIWERVLAEGEREKGGEGTKAWRERVRGDAELRRMWFEGIPEFLRGRAWGLAIGNPLAVSKDAYKSYRARALRALKEGRMPEETLRQLERDLDETLPTLGMFKRGGPMRDDLRELICVWLVYRSDDGMGYAPYITYIAAPLLLASPPAQAFLSLINLLSRPVLRAFYTSDTDEITAYYRVFENLQADMFPKIYANCKNLGCSVPEGWFRSLLVEQIGFETVCRLWDQIVLDGDGYIFRAALAIFGFLEPRLHYPDREEILSVLEGRNRATLAITERERERARLRGEAYAEGVDGKLSVFGLDERALFEWLESDGWKESRFERLVVREMPD